MPLPVTVVRDPWDWAVVWAAIAGVFVAIIAIVFAAVAFYVSNRALVRERRNVFELGLLARLVDICGHNNPGSREVVLGLLRMLPPDDLPGVRREIEQGGGKRSHPERTSGGIQRGGGPAPGGQAADAHLALAVAPFKPVIALSASGSYQRPRAQDRGCHSVRRPSPRRQGPSPERREVMGGPGGRMSATCRATRTRTARLTRYCTRPPHRSPARPSSGLP